MENPLTDEQIKKISEISKLPADKQQAEWGKFAKTLNEEQVKFLQQQQGQGACIFCKIADGSIPSKRIYDDGDIIAVLEIRPATKGHTIVMPKKRSPSSVELPDDLAQ